MQEDETITKLNMRLLDLANKFFSLGKKLVKNIMYFLDKIL